MIGFGPVPGYDALREYPYTRWLPPGRGTVVVSKKTEERAIVAR
jgi:hypothetical protein